MKFAKIGLFVAVCNLQAQVQIPSAKPQDLILYEAIRQNDVAQVTKALADGSNPNAFGAVGMVANWPDRSIEILELLLKSGGTIDDAALFWVRKYIEDGETFWQPAIVEHAKQAKELLSKYGQWREIG